MNAPLRETLRGLLERERELPRVETVAGRVARVIVAKALRGDVPAFEAETLSGTPVRRGLLAYALARCGPREPAYPTGREGVAASALAWLGNECVGARSGFFEKLVESQLVSGSFLRQDPYASPDLHRFDELVLLHALASYVAMFPSVEMEAALLRAVKFHTAETQPDHATNHPWALHAFARTGDGVMTAGMLLHAHQSQNGGRLDPVGQILVADAVLGMG